MEYQAVASSNINGVAYDAAKQELYIEFKGGARYKYSGVPEDDYDGLMGAPSKGQFFASNIKDAYPYQRV